MSLLLAAGPLGQQGGGGGAFDPLSYGSPVHAFWAADPNWTNPGDGNRVTSWRNDGSDGTAATEVSSSGPTFNSSDSNMNGEPSLTFDDASRDYLQAASGSISQPFSISVAFYYPAVNREYLVDGVSSRCIAIVGNSPNRLEMFASSTVTNVSGLAVSPPDVIVAHWVFDGSSSKIVINGGSPVTVTGSPGTNSLGGIVIGGGKYASTVATDSTFGFVSARSGDVTGESWFSEFDDGLIALYGA